MPDSLFFDGTDDQVVCSMGRGNAVPPWSFGVIFKNGRDGTIEVPFGNVDQHWHYNHSISGDNAGLSRPAVADISGPAVLVANGWVLMVVTKTSGTTIPRFHRYIYGTGWAHSNGGATLADWVTPTGNWLIGQGFPTYFYQGNLLVAGIWDRSLSDAEVEALGLERGKEAWYDSMPREAWRLDRLSTISSFALSGTSAESTRTGTTLDTGDAPAGWSDEALGAIIDYSDFPKYVLVPEA